MEKPANAKIDWYLESGEPWTRYRTLIDLLETPITQPRVVAAKQALIAHPQVIALIERAASWPGYPLKRHNDAAHPLYALSTLADFGLRHGDHPLLDQAIECILAHQAPQGAFQTLTQIPQAFGGSGEDQWTWMNCDAPTLLYCLLAMGLESDARVQQATQHLASLVDENGWRCTVAPELGKFRGPGRKADPCPIGNVYALKALVQFPAEPVLADRSALQLARLPEDAPAYLAIRKGVDVLLDHWQNQKERKLYLFGIGSDFRKLKYPLVWYDLLHVVEVLSRFPLLHGESRFLEMLAVLHAQADAQGRYTAGSIYTTWKGWSFGQKKAPSPWLSFLVDRIDARLPVHAP
jgi:hypothetical protein